MGHKTRYFRWELRPRTHLKSEVQDLRPWVHVRGGTLDEGPGTRDPKGGTIVQIPSTFLKEGIDLTKNPKKEGMEKLLKGRGDPTKGIP